MATTKKRPWGVYKKCSPAQKWAQERNWSKRQYRCMHAQLTTLKKKSSTVPQESSRIDAAISLLRVILNDFKDFNVPSKRAYLKRSKNEGDFDL